MAPAASGYAIKVRVLAAKHLPKTDLMVLPPLALRLAFARIPAR